MRRLVLILDAAVLMAVVWLSTGELGCLCQIPIVGLVYNALAL